MENSLTIFEGKPIRHILHNEEIYYSVIDIIQVLSDSPNPNRYWTDLKRRSEKETGQSYEFCVRLNLPRVNGKPYPTDCANTEGVLRIVQSVPSPKAEPFRLWLANLGKQALDEAADPELLSQRQAELYRAKGYTDEWIERRIQSIVTRKKLTDEWKGRGVEEGREYSILTATIAKGTFGLTPSEHAQLKGLEGQNLRDNMTDLELIFTALGEEVTRRLTVENDAQGFNENHDAATEGGKMTGRARENLETSLKAKVVSSDNFLHLKAEKETSELPKVED
jgi:DNA-damage-inducible protein D